MRQTFIVLLLTILSSYSFAQEDNTLGNEGNVFLLGLNAAYQIKGGDYADRFGDNQSIGIGGEYVTNKHNFIFGFHTYFNFGNNVIEDVLSTLRTPDGAIIGNNRLLASVFLRERGIYGGVHVGKLFSLLKSNPRSGIRVTVGAGFLQHKIRIQDDTRTVVQLTGEYKKGYDRLTNGLALTEFIGYQHISKNRFVNFYLGVEFTQGFTQNRRSWNFDTNEKAYAKIAIHTEGDTLHFSTINSKNDANQQKDEVGGVGLKNIRKRLALNYPNQHELVINNLEYAFEVRLKIRMMV